MRSNFKSLKQVESKTNQFEIASKSLARFSAQFRLKESFKLLLYKLRKFGDKSRNSLATKKLLVLGVRTSRRVQSAKLSNRSARTNLEI